MIRIREAIVVEGRYDKHTLAQVVDTVILETAGFGVFHNREQVELLRRLAAVSYTHLTLPTNSLV